MTRSGTSLASDAASNEDLERGQSGSGGADGGDETQALLPREQKQHQEHIATVLARLAVYQKEEDTLEEKYRQEKEKREKAGRQHLATKNRQKKEKRVKLRTLFGQVFRCGEGAAEGGPGAAEGGPGAAEGGPGAAVEGGPGAAEGGPGAAVEGGPVAAEGDHFRLVKNLVYIENSPIHKKALEDWKGKEKLFKLRVERKSSEVSSLKNEVYQLLGFFSVFQGVVLTAVAQSNLLHCNNQWSPITLSVLASVVTVCAIIQKLLQISSLQNIIHSEEKSLKDVVKLEWTLRREGPDFVFAQFAKPKEVGPRQDRIFWLYSGIIIFFLATFSVVFPVSYWRILCHPGSSPGGPSSSPAPA